MKVLNLKGKLFGYWTVLKRIVNNKKGGSMWLCRCKCGKLYKVTGDNLNNNRSTKCRSCASKEIKPFLHTEESKEKISFTKLNQKKYKLRLKNSQGYIGIYCPNHPFKHPHDGRVAEHRLVMEKHLGRYLKPEEVVHHINGIRDDNRIENLILFPNQASHKKFYHISEKTFICKKCGHNQKEEIIC
jgi:uncharacterized protein (DUF1330 family)